MGSPNYFGFDPNRFSDWEGFYSGEDYGDPLGIESWKKKRQAEIDYFNNNKTSMERVGEGIWDAAKLFFDSSPLKPIADKLRDPNVREFANQLPGIKEAGALSGLISGTGALVGMGLDNGPQDTIPDWQDILKRESSEGLPSALEVAAPVDIATLGAGLAAKAPLKGLQAFSKLSSGLDRAEALYGAGQLGGGLLKGNLQEAGTGLLRSALGGAGLAGSHLNRPINFEPSSLRTGPFNVPSLPNYASAMAEGGIPNSSEEGLKKVLGFDPDEDSFIQMLRRQRETGTAIGPGRVPKTIPVYHGTGDVSWAQGKPSNQAELDAFKSRVDDNLHYTLEEAGTNREVVERLSPAARVEVEGFLSTLGDLDSPAPTAFDIPIQKLSPSTITELYALKAQPISEARARELVLEAGIVEPKPQVGNPVPSSRKASSSNMEGGPFYSTVLRSIAEGGYAGGGGSALEAPGGLLELDVTTTKPFDLEGPKPRDFDIRGRTIILEAIRNAENPLQANLYRNEYERFKNATTNREAKRILDDILERSNYPLPQSELTSHRPSITNNGWDAPLFNRPLSPQDQGNLILDALGYDTLTHRDFSSVDPDNPDPRVYVPFRPRHQVKIREATPTLPVSERNVQDLVDQLKSLKPNQANASLRSKIVMELKNRRNKYAGFAGRPTILDDPKMGPLFLEEQERIVADLDAQLKQVTQEFNDYINNAIPEGRSRGLYASGSKGDILERKWKDLQHRAAKERDGLAAAKAYLSPDRPLIEEAVTKSGLYEPPKVELTPEELADLSPEAIMSGIKTREIGTKQITPEIIQRLVDASSPEEVHAFFNQHNPFINAAYPIPKKSKQAPQTTPSDLLRKTLTSLNLTKFTPATLVAEFKRAGVDIDPESLAPLLDELASQGWVNKKATGTFTLQKYPSSSFRQPRVEGTPEGQLGEALQQSLDKPTRIADAELARYISSIAGTEGRRALQTDIPSLQNIYTRTHGNTNLPETITLYRSGKLNPENNFHSYTSDKTIAIQKFGGDIITEQVPREKILTHIDAESWPKNKANDPYNESEFLVLTEKGLSQVGRQSLANPTTRIKDAPPLAEDVKPIELGDMIEGVSKGLGWKPDPFDATRSKVVDSGGFGPKTPNIPTPDELKKLSENGLQAKYGENWQNKMNEAERATLNDLSRGVVPKEVQAVLDSLAPPSNAPAPLTAKEKRQLAIAEKQQKLLEGADPEIVAVKEALISKPASEMVGAEKALPVEPAIRRGTGIIPEEPKGKPSKRPEGYQEKTRWQDSPVVRVFNAAKSLAYGGDVGHLLRQGKQMNVDLLFSKHAKEVLKQFPVLYKSLKSEDFVKKFHGRLATDPDIKLATEKLGLDMPGVGKENLKEEIFHEGGLLEETPIIGKYYAKPFERVYTTGLNFLRAAEVKKHFEALRKNGFTPEKDPEKFKGVTRAINIISQRGDFSKGTAKTLSDLGFIFGAPRAKGARVQNLIELFKAGESGATVRKTAAKMIAFNLGLLGLLKALRPEGEIVDDPKRTDFGKFRDGDTTIDLWTGLGTTIRTAIHAGTGEVTSPHSKRDYAVAPADPAIKEVANMVAPGMRAAWILTTGKDLGSYLTGKPPGGYLVDRSEALSQILPLTPKQIAEILSQDGGIEKLIYSAMQAGGEGVDVFNYDEAREKQERLKAERGTTKTTHKKKKRKVNW